MSLHLPGFRHHEAAIYGDVMIQVLDSHATLWLAVTVADGDWMRDIRVFY